MEVTTTTTTTTIVPPTPQGYRQTPTRILLSVPILFTALVVWYCWQPELFRPIAAALPIGNYTESIADSVAYPGTIPKAFQLGKVLGAESTDAAARLESARELLHAPKLSQANLDNLVQELLQNQENGHFQKILGFLSFVNIVWLLAITGLLVSVGPFVVIWIGPLVVNITIEIVSLIQWLYYHTMDYHDTAGTMFSFCIVLANEKFREGTAEFISLTGCAAATWVYLYFRKRSDTLEATTNTGQNDCAEVAGSICAGALALKFNSELFGFISVAFLYHVIGFGVWCEPLTVYVGFRSEKGIIQAMMASAMFLLLTVTLQVLGIDPLFLRPFKSSLNVFGSVVFLLTGNIARYVIVKAVNFTLVYGISLALSLFIGSVLGIPSLFNSAVVFSVLWVLEIIGGLPFWQDPAGFWTGLFIGSFCIYQLSFYMKTNPDWVMHVFMLL